MLTKTITFTARRRLFIRNPNPLRYSTIIMAPANTTLKLNTGATIPAIGFGTWQDRGSQADAVKEALLAGYRHIDTASIYGTENEVAQGIKASGVPRSEIFLVTKLWNNSHHPDGVEPALDASLKELETDYVDLYLVHWPSSFKRGKTMNPKGADGNIEPGETNYVDTWKAMEKLLKTGKTKAIGISNFSKAEIDRVLEAGTVVPAAHQIEMHPWLQQSDFVKYHDSKGIHITHYSPFGNLNEIYGSEHIKLIEEPLLVEIGKKYGKTGAQVALAWGIGQGHSVIPKSKTPARIKANFEGDFKLAPEDIEKLKEIDHKIRFNNPGDFSYTFFTDLDGVKGSG